MQGITKRLAAVLTLVFGVLLVAACGPGGPGSGEEVTRAEYLAGVQAAGECMREEGFDASEPYEDPAGLYQVSISVPAGAEQSASRAEKVHDSCWRKHALRLEDRYVEGLALSGEEWEANYREMIQCMEAAGVSGLKVGDPEGVVGEAAGDNTEAVICLQRHLFQLFRGDNAE